MGNANTLVRFKTGSLATARMKTNLGVVEVLKTPLGAVELTKTTPWVAKVIVVAETSRRKPVSHLQHQGSENQK